MAKLKTVQEVLKELDTERLIGTYRYDHPFKYEEHQDMMDMTVRQIQDRVKQVLHGYIERLRTLPIKQPSDGRQGLLYVYRRVENGVPAEECGLCFVDELMEKGVECQDYAFEFTEQAEIVGFLVAETPLTQRYLYTLTSQVMYEAAFFGFTQEGLQEEIDALHKAVEDVQEGRGQGRPFDEVLAELDEKYGFKPVRESDDERALRMKVVETEMAYSKCSREKELALILASLQGRKQPNE